MYDALILAGGKGTRLRAVNKNLPKPLTVLNNKTILEHQLELLKESGFKNVAILAGYEANKIINFIDNFQISLNIEVIVETHPLGTGGALNSVINSIDSKCLVMYGDTYLTVNLSKFFHSLGNNDGLLFTHPNNHPHDSDLIEVNEEGLVQKILAYPHPKNLIASNNTNAALYVFNREPLKKTLSSMSGAFDIAKNLLPKMLKENCSIKTYNSSEYIHDMGTPERLERVIKDIKNGVTDPRRKSPAIFLDRDGTVIEEDGYITSHEQIRLIPNVAEAINYFHELGLKVFLLTNQPVLARGDVTKQEFNYIQNKMQTMLGKHGAYFDGIYFCPHHPDSGYEGEIKELKIDCDCRKPGIGMLNDVIEEHSFNLSKSIMIGDTWRDAEFAINAEIEFVLFNQNNLDPELISRYNIKNHLTSWKDIQCLMKKILLDK